MNYRVLGKTGLSVSEISLGTVELGLSYGIPAGDHHRPSPEVAARLLNRAVDLGINLIDTARDYGESEAIIGRALASRRREYLVATKATCPGPGDAANDTQLRERLEASVRESLHALRTDVIDVLQLHSASVDVLRRGDCVEVLDGFRRLGMIRFIGATTYGEDAALAALEGDRIDCLQVAYNLLDRRLESRFLPRATEKQVGIVARSVLLKGALTHRHAVLPESLHELKERVRTLEELVASEPSRLPEAAYRYVLGHPAVSSALVGTCREDELIDALTFASKGTFGSRLQEAIRQVKMSDEAQVDPSRWPALAE